MAVRLQRKRVNIKRVWELGFCVCEGGSRKLEVLSAGIMAVEDTG